MQTKDHWEKVYTTKSADEVSWFQAHAERSLKLIRDAQVPSSAAIIDVGGGASTLVDDLLASNYRNITVLDLSAAALATAKARLGVSAVNVQWLEANVLDVALPKNSYITCSSPSTPRKTRAPAWVCIFPVNCAKAIRPTLTINCAKRAVAACASPSPTRVN